MLKERSQLLYEFTYAKGKNRQNESKVKIMILSEVGGEYIWVTWGTFWDDARVQNLETVGHYAGISLSQHALNWTHVRYVLFTCITPEF